MGLEHIEKKIIQKKRLSFEDGVRLFSSENLLEIGRLANLVREQKNSNKAYFINNIHINHTNICVNECRFCAFGKKIEHENAYKMSVSEVLRTAKKYYNKNVCEFHIVGGLHPDLPFQYYVDMIEQLHNRYPTVHLQAFTAVEIEYFGRIASLSIEEVLQILKAAGLGSLPGGGAEVFSEKIRNKICPEKISGDLWLGVMKTAHSLDIKSNATMLYGHIESVEDRVDHLIRLRDAQEETGGFLTFIPLAFHPKNTDLNSFSNTGGVLDLKMLAISRLMLDNFPHIKAFWIMLGSKIAQLSLSFGADDIDGTIVEEKITHAAGAETEQFIAKEEMIKLIQETGREAVGRDTLYNTIKLYGTSQ